MMGNCNSHQRKLLAESLNERCGSEGAAKRRRRTTRASSSSSSSASLSCNSSRQQQQQQQRQVQNESKEVHPDRTQVELIDLGSELAREDNNHSNDENSAQKFASSSRKPSSEDERRNRLEKLREGLDFIETEEDVKAVEAATLKIQSTFRGKKFRSKAGTKQAAPESKQAEASKTTTTTVTDTSNETNDTQLNQSEQDKANEEKLSSKVAQMQVQDKTNQMEKQNQKVTDNQAGAVEEDEAQRAATKIQAGFKGYKTRKELEGKLSTATGGATAASSQPDG